MNIDDERKAFKQYTALDSNVYNDEFSFWLKAKQHVLDNAKPIAKIMQSLSPFYGSYPWNVISSENNVVLQCCDTEATAHKWANDNGYRVIE